MSTATTAVFEYGCINVKLYSAGSRGRPMIRVTRAAGDVQDTPLVDMPLGVIRQFETQIKRLPKSHPDWRKALQLIS